MRALTLIAITALAGLWGYYGWVVAEAEASAPVLLPVAEDAELSAATLNNRGVALDREGRKADALAYFERARSFRPGDPVLARNHALQTARVRREGWHRALLLSSLAVAVFVAGRVVHRIGVVSADGMRMARLRLRGDVWVRVRPGDEQAELSLRFSEPVKGLTRRHPLTIVWSSAAHGKHMKSRPPAKADGERLVVHLDRDRIDRLRRFPGEWKGFLYLGKTQVGETAALVG